jgi:hypothetical protein
MLKIHSCKVNPITLRTLAYASYYRNLTASSRSTTRQQCRNISFPSLTMRNPFHELALSEWTGRVWGTASTWVPHYYKQYRSRFENEKNSEKTENISWGSLCIVGACICAGSAFHTVKKLNEEMKKSAMVGELTKAEEYLKNMTPISNDEEKNSRIILQSWGQLFKLVFRLIELTIRFTPVVLFYPVALLSPRLMDMWYHLLLYTLRSCGPTFIKIGQWYY